MTQPVFQRRKFFLGRAIRGSNVKDISFFSPSGDEMSDGDWNAGFAKCLGIRLAGDLVNDENERGEPIVGETLLILLNGHWEPIPFKLPPTLHGNVWAMLVDTAEDKPNVRRDLKGPPNIRCKIVRWSSSSLANQKTTGGQSRPPRPEPRRFRDRRERADGPWPFADLSSAAGSFSAREVIVRSDRNCRQAAVASLGERTRRAGQCPESTYRLQFHAGFTFRDALAITPYLSELGVTHCYASPYLKARPGSTHGYDIIDHGSFNPEIGTAEEYDEWVNALHEHGSGSDSRYRA